MAAVMEPAVAVLDLESKPMLGKDEEDKMDDTSIASNEDTEDNSVDSSAEDKSATEDDYVVDSKSDKHEVAESSEEANANNDIPVEEAEVKIRKQRGPRKVVTPKTPPTGHSTGRERKKVERFSVPAEPVKKEKDPAVDKPGKGQKLGDIPFIADMINKTTQKDLLHLHQACFGGRAKQRDIKKQLRIFSGFPFDSDSKEFQMRRTAISKWETKDLKFIFSVLGLKHESNKDNFVTKLMEFCLNPVDSGKVPHTPKSKKSKAKKSGDKSKSKKSVSRKKESAAGKSKKRKHDSDNSDAENEDEEEKLNSAGGSDSDDAGSEPKAKRSKQAPSKKIAKKNESSEEEDKDDESLSESEPEVDSEDEKKKKQKKKPVVAKKGSANSKSKRKAPVQTKPKKIAKKPKSDSESEEQSDAESSGNYDITTISDHDLKKLVQGIVKKADLSAFSMKMVMGQVKEIFKVEQLDPEKKLFIRSMVDEVLSKPK